jgi:hypothetical protein
VPHRHPLRHLSAALPYLLAPGFATNASCSCTLSLPAAEEMILAKKSVFLLAILSALAALALAGPKLQLSWKNPNYTGGAFKKILVLGLNGKASGRADFEDQLVAAITRPGNIARPSYEYMPRPDATPIDMNDMRLLVKDHKFDCIVVAALTKRETKHTYVPGELYSPAPYYGTFYGYYSTVYPVIYSPGYMKTEKVAQVQVNVYATTAPDGELVWTGTTNTFDIGSVMKSIKGLVKVVSKELEKQNVIDPDSQ